MRSRSSRQREGLSRIRHVQYGLPQSDQAGNQQGAASRRRKPWRASGDELPRQEDRPHSVLAEVATSPHGEPSVWPTGKYELNAKIIVVAAGSMHSSALLMRSRLPVDLPALGRYFTCHPALTLVAQHGRPITNYYEFPKTYYSDQFESSEGFILETCMYFPFTTAKSLVGFGAPHSRMMADFRRLQMILVLVSDAATPTNRIVVNDSGEPILDYEVSEESLAAFVKAQKVAAEIFFGAGAERVHAPSSDRFAIERADRGQLSAIIDLSHFKFGKISIESAHPMGGCRIGSDRATSVTDAGGKVHGG